MKSFEKLLDTVRKSNPDLISEQAAQEMLSDYQNNEQKMYDDAFAEGKSAGFEEGFHEGIEKQKAVCKQEMDELLAKCDEEATSKLTSIIDTINNAHAEKLEQIYQMFCKKMDGMVSAAEVEAMCNDHAEKLETAMEAVDAAHAKKMQKLVDMINENHANKLQTLMEAVDAAHAKKLQTVVEAIDENHANKMQTLLEAVDSSHAKKMTTLFESVINSKKRVSNRKYEALIRESNEKLQMAKTALKNEREKKMGMLTESVEKYLNYALQKAIPTKKLVSEAKYASSQKAFDKIASILKINHILQESEDGIFQEYEAKIKNAEAAQNKLMAENANLKDTLDKKEAKLLLESKISKCTPAEAAFLRSYFENAKSRRVIEEQIDDARAAYNRLHSEKRAAAIENAKKTAEPSPSGIVNESKKPAAPVKKEEPSKKVVMESREVKKQNQHSINGINSMNPFVNAYSEMLKNNL